MACSNACPCARALGSFSGRSSRREMDPDCRENQRRRRIAGRPATRITGARRLLILRFSRGHVTAERYLQFEAEARHPRTPTGEGPASYLSTSTRPTLQAGASRRSGVPVSSNCRVGHAFSAPHAIVTLLRSKWLHPGVVKASGNREKIAGGEHVVAIQQ